MTERLKFTRPMVRRSASLDANQARWQLLKESQDMATRQLARNDHLAGGVNAEARRSGEVHSTWCNIAKAAREFGYNAPTDLEAGLQTTWSWYLENREIWVRQQAWSASD
jgi:nucleoside-diphosphate-sugar epimerase